MEALVIDNNSEWAHLIQGALYNKDYTAVERAGSWAEAMEFLKEEKTWDLVVSVLRMPNPNPSIQKTTTWTKELRLHLKNNKSSPVVFMKDSDDDESYEETQERFPSAILSRSNYTEANLTKAIQEAEQRYHEADWDSPPFSLVYKNTILQDFIFFTSNDNRLHIVNSEEIFYIKAKGGHVHVYKEDQEHYAYYVRQSMAKVAKDLPKGHFFSPHRGFLVNINKISCIDRHQRIIELTNGIHIPMTHDVKDAMQNLLKIW